jgi:hypothetical protein
VVTKNRSTPQTFRNTQARELDRLAILLGKYRNICPNTGPLHTAAKQCRSFPKKSDLWGYKLDRLQFYVEKPRHTFPENISDTLVVELSVTVEGKCHPVKSDDPFEQLAVNIVVSGKNPYQPENICAWHLDRHIDSESEVVHPLYHFQYGGNRMEHLKDDLGRVLLLETPRLVHPPMEAVLAIDFVLSNFVGATWKQIKEEKDGTYRNMVAEAQERFWYPYAESIAARWGKPPKDSRVLWPTLIFP